MHIILATDHRGFPLKEVLKEFLIAEGHGVEDVGADHLNPEDDYVDFAVAGVEKVLSAPDAKGIFICGSGHGVDIVANRFKGIRAALGFNLDVARQSREHEDSNVLVLPADWLENEKAKEIVRAWLSAKFTGEERHMRRLKKIEEL